MGQGFNEGDYNIANVAISNAAMVTDVTSIGGRSFAMAAVPIYKGNTIVAAIVVSSSMSDVESAVALVQRLMAIAAAVALVVALLVIYLVSYTLSRRIRRIESGAARIAEGDFDIKVPVTSQDELGQLAGTFNNMGDKLGSAFQQVDDERRAQVLLTISARRHRHRYRGPDHRGEPGRREAAGPRDRRPCSLKTACRRRSTTFGSP